ncbi:hypothetical protein JKA74_00655 [Marivirga sp. S37H4]|uniref:Uncharacterized protein n=1 Tax=Marivirga aurantiaca TaxID=2802615 RepID=A0A934WV65_9BACT|nr:hypothetical protein [Marivirga aurantiaca]MBK6263527.1 hypothetical protein [Marivirga aurantiaca]
MAFNDPHTSNKKGENTPKSGDPRTNFEYHGYYLNIWLGALVRYLINCGTRDAPQ